MPFVWTCAIKDLRLIRRDPAMVLVWVGIPLFIAVTLSLVFGRGATTPQGRLLVADQDDTFISAALTSGFSREPLSKMALIEKVQLDEGRRRMGRGDASALLIIPVGFGNAFLRRQPSQIELITNPSQRVLPGIIQETLSIMLDGGFYLQSLLGDQLDVFGQGPPSNQTVVASSIAINRLVTDLRRYLSPLLIELDTQVIQEKVVNFGLLFFPGMLFMALLFIAGSLSRELWKERAQGTLRRLAVTPGKLEAFLAGKLIAAGAIFGGISAVALFGGADLVDVPIRHAPAAVLWMIFSGSVLFLLLALLTLFASSQRAASVLNNLVIFPLAMVGGAFFPFEVMPDSFVRIGRLTPNGWALGQLKTILSGSADLGALAWSFAGLAIAGAVAFLLAMRRMRRAFVV